MNLKKIMLIGGLALVALIVVAVLGLAIFLDGIIKTAVNTAGPKVIHAPLTLESIHIGVLSGSAKVQGLVVGNPDGFKSPFAVKVGLAEVSVAVGSALSDKIVIHSVHAIAPEITFEGGFKGNNLAQLAANVNESVKELTGAANTNAAAASTTNQPAAAPGKKLEVDDFLISGAKLHVSFTDLGGKELDLPLPDIHLTDLGKGDAGITPAELTRDVLKAVAESSLKAVTSALGDVVKDLGGLGKNAGKAAAGALDKIGKFFKP